MGKSKETKQVNKDLSNRYAQVSGGNNPFDQFAAELKPKLFDSSKSDNMYGNLAGKFENLYDTGGLSPENISRIRGNGGYDEFAKTGGYNAGDLANIRSRAGSAIPSFFGRLKENMSRQNTINNGINPGYTAQMSKMARDQGQAAQEASLNAELGIKDAVNAGRKFGISGISDAESRIGSLLNQGRNTALSGMTHLFDSDRSQESDMIGNYLKALGMSADQINGLLGMRSGRNPDQSAFDKWGTNILGSAGGILGAF